MRGIDGIFLNVFLDVFEADLIHRGRRISIIISEYVFMIVESLSQINSSLFTIVFIAA